MESILYAIGDIHGRDDLLADLHQQISEHHQAHHADRPAEIIHLGDYIDRGPSSAQVIDRLIPGLEGVTVVNLMGNHELMMLECLEPDAYLWASWLLNGGDSTLVSLGVTPNGPDPDELAKALGPERLSWIANLPLFYTKGPYLFVHAGIAPGVPIEEQSPQDLLWIRSPFLESDEPHDRIVIHGHTPGLKPVVRPNRICLDTGAVGTGVLTAVVLEDEKPPLFLQTQGAPDPLFA